MGYSKGPAKVALSVFDGRSVTMEGYASLKEMVHDLVSGSSTWTGASWADQAHLYALQELRDVIDTTIVKVEDAIEEERKYPNGRCQCGTPDGKQCTRAPAHGDLCAECYEDMDHKAEFQSGAPCTHCKTED